ncbi:MAG: nucleotidyltransferase family protein [Deltaproteobacteria bacterium]|nr:nucleotidyltransferase family protein [Deltaproteobacteria bacterium]
MQKSKMPKSWSNVKCVILCGGKGTRLLPLSLKKQKGMIFVNGKPVLRHVIDYWRQFTDDFIFVVKYKKADIYKFAKALPINAEFVEPKELEGIANGIEQAKGLVGDKFIVVLGDCVCRGSFKIPPYMEQGVCIWETDNKEDIKRSYSVKIEKDLVSRVKEKPKRLVNNLCGMGFYFFDRKVFEYIEKTKPSLLRNEVEITDVIQSMIDAGEKISPIFFKGDYLNITYTEDLKRAEEILI